MKLHHLYVLLLCVSLSSVWIAKAESIAVDGAANANLAGADHDDGRSRVNLSRDLVRLGIASQNLIPDDPTLAARPLFQAALVYVEKHHTSLLSLDRGS